MEKNYYLHKSAREAYRSYILAYSSHSHKEIFNVHNLDLQKVSKAFGFVAPPKINLSKWLKVIFVFTFLDMTEIGKKVTRVGGRDPRKKIFGRGKGHTFSASNPYGKKVEGDKRQFVH